MVYQYVYVCEGCGREGEEPTNNQPRKCIFILASHSGDRPDDSLNGPCPVECSTCTWVRWRPDVNEAHGLYPHWIREYKNRGAAFLCTECGRDIGCTYLTPFSDVGEFNILPLRNYNGLNDCPAGIGDPELNRIWYVEGDH